jgi:sugar lactone lactonase YvrE
MKMHTYHRSATFLVTAAIAVFAACTDDTPRSQACEIEELTNQLKNPFGLLARGDDIIVAGVDRLAKISKDTTVSTLATLVNGTGMVELGGSVYIVEYLEKKIYRYDPATWTAAPFATLPAGGISLAVDGQDLIVTATDPASPPPAVLRVKPDASVAVVSDKGVGAPAGVITDGDAYLVTDYFGGRLLRITRAGEVTEVATGLGNPVELRKYNGAYYVGDNAGGVAKGRLLKVTPAGAVTVIDTPDTLGNPSAMILRGSEMILTDDQHGRVLVLRGCLN